MAIITELLMESLGGKAMGENGTFWTALHAPGDFHVLLYLTVLKLGGCLSHFVAKEVVSQLKTL